MATSKSGTLLLVANIPNGARGERARGQFIDPGGVTVASDGSVYVTDSGNNRIQKFSVGQ